MVKRILMILGGLALVLLAVLLLIGFVPIPPDVPTGQPQPFPSDLEKCPPKVVSGSTTAQTLTVHAGDKIQDAVDRANPGDTVLISPGVYSETVRVKANGITLRGIVENNQRPILDGNNTAGNGVIACGDNFTIENLTVRNYTGNGVLVQNVDGVTFRNVFTDHTGEYGLFPVDSKNILIDHCIATGVSDTGLYVGQSQDIVVRDSEAYGNVSGLEIEDSSNALVERNYVHDNSAGLLVFVLPDLARKETTNNTIRDNRIIANNLANFAHRGDIVSNVPAGIGMLVMAADRNEVTGNEIRDNRSAGIVMVSLRSIMSTRADFDVGTEPEGNWIHDDTFQNNGRDPTPEALQFGLLGADLVWDGSGWDNSWQESTQSRFPPFLPDRSWPDFARRAYTRVLAVARRLF